MGFFIIKSGYPGGIEKHRSGWKRTAKAALDIIERIVTPASTLHRKEKGQQTELSKKTIKSTVA